GGCERLVSGLWAEGWVWGGSVGLRMRGVGPGAARVHAPEQRSPPGGRGVARWRAHGRRGGGRWGRGWGKRPNGRGPRRRRVRFAPQRGIPGLRVPKLHRLEERRSDRQAVPPCGRETQLACAGERCRVE